MRFFSLCCIIIISFSCSLKEDRRACPAILYLDFADKYEQSASHLKIIADGVVVWEDTLNLDGSILNYSVSVPRKNIHLRVWAGAGDLVKDDGLLIPVGGDCPEVYMHDSDVVVTGEEAREVIRLRKNHCLLTVKTENAETFPFAIHLSGRICGYSALGEPLEGEFYSPMKMSDTGNVWEIVLPRQKDSSLMLHVSDDSGVLKSFALGQYLLSGGYDWDALDLADVSITLDYALTQIKILIDGWESVYTFDMEI